MFVEYLAYRKADVSLQQLGALAIRLEWWSYDKCVYDAPIQEYIEQLVSYSVLGQTQNLLLSAERK